MGTAVGRSRHTCEEGATHLRVYCASPKCIRGEQGREGNFVGADPESGLEASLRDWVR